MNPVPYTSSSTLLDVAKSSLQKYEKYASLPSQAQDQVARTVALRAIQASPHQAVKQSVLESKNLAQATRLEIEQLGKKLAEKNASVLIAFFENLGKECAYRVPELSAFLENLPAHLSLCDKAHCLRIWLKTNQELLDKIDFPTFLLIGLKQLEQHQSFRVRYIDFAELSFGGSLYAKTAEEIRSLEKEIEASAPPLTLEIPPEVICLRNLSFILRHMLFNYCVAKRDFLTADKMLNTQFYSKNSSEALFNGSLHKVLYTCKSAEDFRLVRRWPEFQSPVFTFQLGFVTLQQITLRAIVLGDRGSYFEISQFPVFKHLSGNEMESLIEAAAAAPRGFWDIVEDLLQLPHAAELRPAYKAILKEQAAHAGQEAIVKRLGLD